MHGRIGRQKMLAEIYKECGSIFGKGNTPMTDKQIIIDNIDVSGCPHLIEDYQWWNIAGREEHDINICALSFDDYRDFEEDYFCKDNPNCYYKQLLRKEQECKELKTKLINWLGKVSLRQSEKEFCEQQLNQLKVELQAEKEKVKELNKVAEYFMEEDGKIYTRKEYKYKQTLAEIKPILELYANSKIGEEQPDGTYKLSGGIWDGLGICTTTYDPRPAREGLKKISECEVENEN